MALHREPANDGVRRWREPWRGARPRLLAFALSSLTAVILVALLAQQAVRSRREQERLIDRSLRDYAAFGAASFFSRSASLIVSTAGYLLSVADASLSRTGSIDVALGATMAVADSAMVCDCGPAVRLTEVWIVDQRTGATLASRRQADVPTAAGLVDPMRILASAGPELRWRLYGTDSSGSLVAMRRLEATSRGAPLVLVLAFDSRTVNDEIFQRVYRTFPPLLPSALLRATRNDSVIAIDLRSTDGGTFAHFGPVTARRQQSVQQYGGQNTAAVIANLTPMAEDVLRTTLLGTSKASMVALLAAATLLAVCSAMWFAWRSERLGRLRMDFASSISHELRTPLTEIMLYAELIESGRTRGSTAIASAARTIRGEAGRLHQMVENALHIARTARRLVRVSVTPESVTALVDDVLATYTPLAARRDVTLSHAYETDVTASVDPDAVRRILLNVLDNAMRYGPAGGRVRVATERRGGMATITVDDDGPGIPVRDRTRVFRPHVRLDRDLGQVTTGNGIGLAVVADLAREMRGTVHIEEAPGGGTRVVLQFPSPGEPDEQEADHSRAFTHTGAEPSMRRP